VTYRVIQWSTGNVGRHALRCIERNPDLELVGLWVHSADKAGRDAGELAGLAPNGVLATNDVMALASTPTASATRPPPTSRPNRLKDTQDPGPQERRRARSSMIIRRTGSVCASRSKPRRAGNVVLTSGIDPLANDRCRSCSPARASTSTSYA
jgi:hypothetical protein